MVFPAVAVWMNFAATAEGGTAVNVEVDVAVKVGVKVGVKLDVHVQVAVGGGTVSDGIAGKGEAVSETAGGGAPPGPVVGVTTMTMGVDGWSVATEILQARLTAAKTAVKKKAGRFMAVSFTEPAGGKDDGTCRIIRRIP